MQKLEFGGSDCDYGLKWYDDDPNTVAYLCKHCQSLIENGDLMTIQDDGIWRCEETEIETVDGIIYTLNGHEIEPPESVAFYVWQIYSPFAPWKSIVRDFLKSKGDQGMLKSFVNLTLGEPWEDEGSQRLEAVDLIRRREGYAAKVPSDVLYLTFAADVQADRIEGLVCGWTEKEEMYVIEWQMFRGYPSKREIWDRLDEYLLTRFKHETGIQIQIGAAFIDSGYLSSQVRKFTKPREARGVFACRGHSTLSAPVVNNRPSTNNELKAPVFYVGSSSAKELVFSRLQIQEVGAGYVHFPISESIDTEFFEQIVAEKPVIKYKNGHPERVWTKVRERNEALDLLCYNYAALYAANPQFKKIKSALNKTEPTPEPQHATAKIMKQRRAARRRPTTRRG